MAKINIYYVFSALGIIALISYLWLVFLPLFAGSEEYISVRNWMVVISLALAVTMVLNLIMAKRHP